MKEKLNILKGLVGIEGREKDILLQFILDNVEETVKNYCNLQTVPEGLQNTVMRMAVDIYRNEQLGNEDIPMVLKSISAGDTSSSFDILDSTGYTKMVLKDYKMQLNRYRKAGFHGSG